MIITYDEIELRNEVENRLLDEYIPSFMETIKEAQKIGDEIKEGGNFSKLWKAQRALLKKFPFGFYDSITIGE